MCVVTGLYGVLVVLLGIAEQLWVAYTAFVVYHAAFELMAPVASAEVCCRLCVCVCRSGAYAGVQVARRVLSRRFALVFALNSVLALALQTGLQAGVSALNLGLRSQFRVWGYVELLLASLSCAYVVWRLFHRLACRQAHSMLPPTA
jgi:hypothetical protein